MEGNTFDTNRQTTSAQINDLNNDSFFYRNRKIIFWVFLIILVGVTWYFSQSIETRSTNTASIFLSGSQKTDIVYLYKDRVEPMSLSVRIGGTVEFVVRDENIHYISERKTVSRRGDARISSGEFGPGESYSVQFNTPGSFSFYDRMNQDISIDIEVR